MEMGTWLYDKKSKNGGVLWSSSPYLLSSVVFRALLVCLFFNWVSNFPKRVSSCSSVVAILFYRQFLVMKIESSFNSNTSFPIIFYLTLVMSTSNDSNFNVAVAALATCSWNDISWRLQCTLYNMLWWYPERRTHHYSESEISHPPFTRGGGPCWSSINIQIRDERSQLPLQQANINATSVLLLLYLHWWVLPSLP